MNLLKSTLAGIFVSFSVDASVLDRPSFVFDGSSAFNVVIDETLFNYQQENELFLQFEKQNSGTSASVQAFCDASVDIIIAQRPLTPDEASGCADNLVTYIEMPIGYDVGQFFVSADSDLPDQLVTEEVLWVWSIDVSGGQANWNEINSALDPMPITFYGPEKENETLELIGGRAAGENLSDIVVTDFTDYEELVDLTAQSEGALALIPSLYNAGLFSPLKPVTLTEDDDIDQYVRVDRSAVSFRIPVILYINEESLFKDHVSEAMRFLVERIGLVAEGVGLQQLEPDVFRRVVASFIAYLDAGAEPPSLELINASTR